MKSTTQKRILADVLLILTFFWLPWWCSLALAIIFFFFFSDFIELLCLGVAIDLLYSGINLQGFYIFFACALIYIILILVKRRLR